MVFGLLSEWQDSLTRIKVTENVRRKHWLHARCLKYPRIYRIGVMEYTSKPRSGEPLHDTYRTQEERHNTLAYKCGPFSLHTALKVQVSRLLRYGVDIFIMHSISLLIKCVCHLLLHCIGISRGFRAPGLWHSVIGWVIPDNLKDCGVLIFVDHEVREELFSRWRWRRCLSSKWQEALAQRHSVASQTSWILSRAAVRTPSLAKG